METAQAIILWRKKYIVFPGQERPPAPPAPPPPPRAPAAKSAPSGPRATTPPRAPAAKSTPSRSCPYEPAPSRQKKAKSDEPWLPALKKRAYNLTPGELDEAVRAKVREQMKPRSLEKKILIAPEVQDHFIKMAEPGKPVEVSDHDRTLRKALQAKHAAVKCGKDVP